MIPRTDLAVMTCTGPRLAGVGLWLLTRPMVCAAEWRRKDKR